MSHAHMIIKKRSGTWIDIQDKRLLNASSNDYLGIGQRPLSLERIEHIRETLGQGSTGSPSLSGKTYLHETFENACAQWLEHESALLCSSGYHANLIVSEWLSRHQHHVLADKHVHASIIDGFTLHNVNFKRYHHGNINHFKDCITRHAPTCVYTEGLFSMDGDTPHTDLLKHTPPSCLLVIDEAHSLGVLGKEGRGWWHHTPHRFMNTLGIYPLGKSFACQGAIIAGNKDIIDDLTSCRSYRYSTATSPLLVNYLIESLNLIKNAQPSRTHLFALIDQFQKEALEKNLPITPLACGPIQPLLFNDRTYTLHVEKHCLEKGFFIKAITHPTVPLGRDMIRVSLTANMDAKNITDLTNALQEACATWAPE